MQDVEIETKLQDVKLHTIVHTISIDAHHGSCTASFTSSMYTRWSSIS